VEDLIKMTVKRIEEKHSTFNLTREFLDLIDQKLWEGSQGSFLWVGIVAAELVKAPLRTLLDKLNNFPKTLERLYDRILNSITESDQEDCEKISRWVAFAKEALTTS
jgi:hypothetical protein